VNVYKISQNLYQWYETYFSAVVIAPDENAARNIDPSTGEQMNWGEQRLDTDPAGKPWSWWAVKPEEVIVELIGVATDGEKQRVVCAQSADD